MGKLSTLLATAFLALAGCAGTTHTTDHDWDRYYSGRSPSSAPTHGCIAKEGPACNTRIMWHCPTGFIDGCNTPGSTGKHECVVRESDTACNLRVEMLCPTGFADGCDNGSSQNHACLPKTSAIP